MTAPRFPHIFALTARHGRNRHDGLTVWVFDAVPLHHHHHPHHMAAGGGRGDEVFRIAPHATQRDFAPPPPAFFVENDIPNNYYNRDHVTLVLDGPRGRHPYRHDWDSWNQRSDLQCMWRFTGTMIYCMTLAEPIPLIELENTEEILQELASPRNELHAAQGDRHVRRIWDRRWDMSEIEEEMAEEAARRRERRERREAREAAAAAAAAAAARPPAPVQQPQPPQPQLTPIPKYVADLIIADAVAKATTCPITMEPIKADAAAVTTCFHVFDATAIASWFAAGNSTCAVCRKPAIV